MVWSVTKLALSVSIGLGLIVVFIVLSKSLSNLSDTIPVNVAGYVIEASLADSPTEQKTGLVGRQSLTDQEGMVFVFPSSFERDFWMKDMSMAIDLIWVDGGKIVGLIDHLEPQTSPPFTYYHSPQPVDMVVEVASGWIKRHDLQIGQNVRLDN